MDFSLFLDPVTKQYADFRGTTGRQAFWMYILYYIISLMIVSIVTGIVHLWPLYGLYALAMFLPTLSIEVRRLHDVGKSGWWLLVAFVPVLGALYLIFLCAQPSSTPYGE